jgi:hypothetical protein
MDLSITSSAIYSSQGWLKRLIYVPKYNNETNLRFPKEVFHAKGFSATPDFRERYAYHCLRAALYYLVTINIIDLPDVNDKDNTVYKLLQDYIPTLCADKEKARHVLLERRTLSTLTTVSYDANYIVTVNNHYPSRTFVGPLALEQYAIYSCRAAKAHIVKTTDTRSVDIVLPEYKFTHAATELGNRTLPDFLSLAEIPDDNEPIIRLIDRDSARPRKQVCHKSVYGGNTPPSHVPQLQRHYTIYTDNKTNREIEIEKAEIYYSYWKEWILRYHHDHISTV